MLTVFYSSQAPMKSVWNPLVPQINIIEQCESLCKRQVIFENPPEPTLSFDIGTEKIQYFGYMLISPTRGVVFSLFRDSYNKSVRLGGFKSVELLYLNGGVTTDFFLFSELKYERKRVHFSPYEFFFIISIYTLYMKEKNVLPCAHIYPGL